MLKRVIGCTIWILGAILVIALLDSVPDPPALDPHASVVKITAPGGSLQAEDTQFQNTSSPGLIAQGATSFKADTDPHCPVADLAETGHAADSSPPAHV